MLLLIMLNFFGKSICTYCNLAFHMMFCSGSTHACHLGKDCTNRFTEKLGCYTILLLILVYSEIVGS